MGRENNITCVDCKTHYDCGSQRYGHWLVAHSLEEWEAQAEKHPDLAKTGQNLAIKKVLAEHSDHRLIPWWSDFYGLSEDDKLYTEPPIGEFELLADCAGFKWETV